MLTTGVLGQIIPSTQFYDEIVVEVQAEAGCCCGRSTVLSYLRNTPGGFEKAAAALGLAHFVCNSQRFSSQMGKVFRVV